MMQAGGGTDTRESSEVQLREALSRFARGASVETGARAPEEVDGYGELLPAGTEVYVAWIPGATPEHALGVSRHLRRANLRPVPHVAARDLTGKEEARRLIAGLGDVGVDTVLLIGGDRPVPRGPFPDALSLLESGLFQAAGIGRIGVAGYPEGHARISDEVLTGALAAKLAAAGAQGLSVFIVSQFCFDPQVVLDWVGRLRSDGVMAPVRVGMAGPAKIGTLIKYGMRCGIGNSLRMLSSHAKQVSQLLSSQGPEPVAVPVALAESSLGIEGWHFFAFGGFARTVAWLRAVAAGRVQSLPGGGFRAVDA